MEAMMRHMRDEDGSPRRRISPEGVIARARELVARFDAGCPFRVGDVVTPRADGAVRGAGEPHVVAELRPSAEPDFGAGSVGGVPWGGRYDMRVACVQNDCTVMHWVESVYFEPYEAAP